MFQFQLCHLNFRVNSTFIFFRSNLGYIVNIEKDPEMTRLAAEARRLSMGISNGNGHTNSDIVNNSRASISDHANNSRASISDHANNSRASSEGRNDSAPNSRKSSSSETCNNCHNSKSPRPVVNGRRTSDIPIFSRKTSEGLGIGNNRRSSNVSITDSGRKMSSDRKMSSECDASELQQRRLSEAGLRRSSSSDVVLNENTSNLMVGMRVWVDGTKPGEHFNRCV